MSEGGSAGREFDLWSRLIEFTIRVLNIVESMPDSRLGKHIAGQLVRCGTAPAPNYSEACAAESRRDVIHKMKVCLKELRETHTWLTIVQRKPVIEPAGKLAPIISECNELIAIFVASIETARTNVQKESRQ